MKSRKITTVFFFILVPVVLAFIWGNSLQSVNKSTIISEQLTSFFLKIIKFFNGHIYVTDHLIRKTAHVIEYSAFGCILAILIILRTRTKVQDIANALFFGLSAAVIDESLQLISGRGSQVTDILIDFCGIVCGIGAIMLTHKLLGIKNQINGHCL